jgi:hypothetical protein
LVSTPISSSVWARNSAIEAQAQCVVAPLGAGLDLQAGLRLQRGVEAGAAVGPVGQFVQRR